MRVRAWLLLGLPLTLVAAAPFGYSLTSSNSPRLSAVPKPRADPHKAAERLCASRSVNERLKARVFDDAAAVGNGNSANLDLLASFSEVRMDEPLLKSEDRELGVTVCSGRFVLLLPPGSELRFDGRTLLQADVEYAAQPAADGSGLVYQLRGADSIVYRLAAYNLRADPAVARKRETQLAAAEPLPAEALPPPLPVAAKSSPPALAKAPDAGPPPKAVVEHAKQVKVTVSVAKKTKPERAMMPPQNKLRLAKAETHKPAKLAKVDAKRVPAKGDRIASAKPDRKASKTRHIELAEAGPRPKAIEKKPTKPLKLARTTPKAAPAKPAARTSAAPKAKPVALAAAAESKPPKSIASSGTENSFLAYERRQAPVPAPRRASSDHTCDSAGGTEARLICANPNLAAKKRAVANFYLSALEDADGATRRTLDRTRSQFASYLNRCSTASCLAEAYDGRIAEIRDIMRSF